jgi:hypothetical protein
MLHYALFNAHPASQPPFVLMLGLDNEIVQLENCAHIPDAIEKLVQYCQANQIELSAEFTLLYPIYMDAMNTNNEMTMLNIAWLIKDAADAKSWQFGRVGGLTGLRAEDFIK